jgi:hypothetical protein
VERVVLEWFTMVLVVVSVVVCILTVGAELSQSFAYYFAASKLRYVELKEKAAKVSVVQKVKNRVRGLLRRRRPEVADADGDAAGFSASRRKAFLVEENPLHTATSRAAGTHKLSTASIPVTLRGAAAAAAAAGTGAGDAVDEKADAGVSASTAAQHRLDMILKAVRAQREVRVRLRALLSACLR